MTFTRRTFLRRLGAAGGYGAAYSAMHALGYFPLAAQAAAPLPATAGTGLRVAVLGAGIAGLTAAYELERAGFAVTLLEARGRLGGRAWTVRGGDKIEMVGKETQTCRFSDGVYFNAGPARIPSHHDNLLRYCRDLGVTMEVEVNASRSAFIMGDDGKAIQMRAAVNDTRGHISELLAKAVNQGSLDQVLSAEDKEKLLPFLKAYGDLDAGFAYTGSDRSGFVQAPGAADTYAVPKTPLGLSELLANEKLTRTVFEDGVTMQATMFQPAGGMQQIAEGFGRAIKSPIHLNAEVRDIRMRGAAVDVAWRDTARGATHTVQADYVICTVPLPVLAKIDSNFSRPVKQAIAGVPYAYSNKVAFESKRFWEAQHIYGGISFVPGETALIWYPSAGLNSDTPALLLACYNSGKDGETFARRPLAEQVAMSRAAVERLHPGQGAELQMPVVVNWDKIPYNLGPWPDWAANGNHGAGEGRISTPAFNLLNQPDGRVYFAGAHLSQTPGWQEGAVLSALRVVGMIGERAKAGRLASAH